MEKRTVEIFSTQNPCTKLLPESLYTATINHIGFSEDGEALIVGLEVSHYKHGTKLITDEIALNNHEGKIRITHLFASTGLTLDAGSQDPTMLLNNQCVVRIRKTVINDIHINYIDAYIIRW